MKNKDVNTFDDVFDANSILVFCNRSAIKTVKSNISENENVYFASALNVSLVNNTNDLEITFNSKNVTNGIFAVTEKRIIFSDVRLGNGKIKQILVKDIQSIDSRTSLVNCPIRIKGITDMFIVDCNKKTHDKLMKALNMISK